MFSCSINSGGHGIQFAEQCGANKTPLDSHVGRFISASCRGDLRVMSASARVDVRVRLRACGHMCCTPRMNSFEGMF